MASISRIEAREILDSRGNPTVEVDVYLADGSRGRAAVPSGASTGANEAVELRDADPTRYGGLGVQLPVRAVYDEIAPAVRGRSDLDQQSLDTLLIELDGTAKKSRLGGNAVLGVSLAFARACAKSRRIAPYRYLGGALQPLLPVPMLNILNGGKHAAGSTDIQEFMVVPAGFDSFAEALRAGVEVYHALGAALSEKGLSTTVGDEGGFAPSLSTDRRALELVLQAIERAGYRPGRQCFIALDVAASELWAEGNGYSLPKSPEATSAEDLIELYRGWVDEYPIISIEDGLAEDDWQSWAFQTASLGGKVQLVGDDIYCTNPGLIGRGIGEATSNAVLVKLNQIATVSETIEAVDMSRNAGWGIVISHRSGETEDTSIADLAVGTAAGQIKSGAPARTERTAKYNRLLRIEEELGDDARFAGRAVYERFLG